MGYHASTSCNDDGFPGEPRRFWIVNDRQGPSVCIVDPGFDVDAQITASLSTMYQLWLGREPLRHALDRGSITLAGGRRSSGRCRRRSS